MVNPSTIKEVAYGDIPEGKVVMTDAKKVFKNLQLFMEIPVWEWDHEHPYVPMQLMSGFI